MTETEKIVDHFIKSAVAGVNKDTLVTQKNWYTYVSNLPVPERFIYLLSMLNMEVSNGGFLQYFDNRYGLFCELTLDVLRLINANKSFGILEEVIVKVNYDNDPSEVFRQKIFNQDIDQLNDMDSQLVDFLETITHKFNELEDEDENLGQLYVDYLTKTGQMPILS